MKFFRRIFCAAVFLAAVAIARGGTWAPLINHPPDSITTLLLLSDGTVMAANAGETNWYRLTPDIHGSYVNGTWKAPAGMHYSRLYYASVVLTNGNVLVAGGEYGSPGMQPEVYDPVSNVWTVVPTPANIITNDGFEDSVSEILPDGNVLVAPNDPATNGNTALFITASNIWTVGPKLFRGNNQAECSWVKLPDDSILTVDPAGITNSERFIPALGTWINDSSLPLQIHSSTGDEMGAAFLLPSGQAIFLGGNGKTAIYTPTGNTNPGIWTAGPPVPNGYGIMDGPGAMMVNGKILCAVGNPTNYSAPTYFFEYDPVSNSFAQVNGPTGISDSIPPFDGRMLDLPDGTVLYSHFGSDLYIYRPDGLPLGAGKPGISNITANVDGSFTLTGTLLNGISEGAGYGDDAQMNSNYPLVRVTDSAGNVYYERTYNWNCTGVQTGTRLVSTRFTNSAALPPGDYSLVVVANGISSDAVTFTLSPRLGIVLSGDNVVLSWPTNATGFFLESATNFDFAPIQSLQAPTVVNGQNVVINSISHAGMFFRLSR